jgi:hypothetical protein
MHTKQAKDPHIPCSPTNRSVSVSTTARRWSTTGIRDRCDFDTTSHPGQATTAPHGGSKPSSVRAGYPRRRRQRPHSQDDVTAPSRPAWALRVNHRVASPRDGDDVTGIGEVYPLSLLCIGEVRGVSYLLGGVRSTNNRDPACDTTARPISADSDAGAVAIAFTSKFLLCRDSGRRDGRGGVAPAAVEELGMSSWQPIDLVPYLEGTVRRPEPGILRRSDGVGFTPGGCTRSTVRASPGSRGRSDRCCSGHCLRRSRAVGGL